MRDDSGRKGQLRIHIVENHTDTLKYLAKFVEELGHSTHCTRSVQEALSVLKEIPCEVLISDIGLPDGSGWELLRHLRDSNGAEIYAIAMSGYGMQGDRKKSRAAGFRHHLLKPFDPAKLEIYLQEASRELAVHQLENNNSL